MNQAALVWLAEWFIMGLAALALTLIVSATLYEIRTMAARRRLATADGQSQTHLTVLVYASRNVDTVRDCLDSVRRGGYRNYDVVVIDNKNGLSDGTRRVINDYQRQYPIFPLYFLAKRKPSLRHQALRQGYAKSQNGQVVLALSAASMVSPSSIERSIIRLLAEPRTGALLPNDYYPSIDGLDRLSRRLWQLSRHLIFKSISWLALLTVEVGQLNVYYKRTAFTDHSQRRVSCGYDGTNIMASSGSGWPIPVAFIVPVTALVGFCVYTAAMHDSSLLTFSWLLVVGWLLAAVWSDEASRPFEKAVLIFCLPAVYFLWLPEVIIRLTGRISRSTKGLKFDLKFNQLTEPKL